MSSLCKLTSLDHLVLTVRSIPAAVAFYQSLGMKLYKFESPTDGSHRHALIFGSQKINLHQSGSEFEPKAASVMPGSADLCFITENNLDNLPKVFKDNGIDLLEGGKVTERTGAQGKLRSVYIRDPDGNLIE